MAVRTEFLYLSLRTEWFSYHDKTNTERRYQDTRNLGIDIGNHSGNKDMYMDIYREDSTNYNPHVSLPILSHHIHDRYYHNTSHFHCTLDIILLSFNLLNTSHFILCM